MPNLHLAYRSYDESLYPQYLRLFAPFDLDLGRLSDPAYLKQIAQSGFLVGGHCRRNYLLSSPFCQFAWLDTEAVGMIRLNKVTKEAEAKVVPPVPLV